MVGGDAAEDQQDEEGQEDVHRGAPGEVLSDSAEPFAGPRMTAGSGAGFDEGNCARKKPSKVSVNASLSSPATMCVASGRRTCRACGTSSLEMGDGVIGHQVAAAAADQQHGNIDLAGGVGDDVLEVLAAGDEFAEQARVPVPLQALLLVGPQQVRQLRRRLALAAVRKVVGDDLRGVFEASRSPPGWAVMKAWMRCAPAVSQRGVTSTSTSAENRRCCACASSPVSPPIEAPTSTGRPTQRGGRRDVVADELPGRVGRVAGIAIRLAVAAHVESQAGVAVADQPGLRGRPALPGLSEAMGEQHRRAGRRRGGWRPAAGHRRQGSSAVRPSGS